MTGRASARGGTLQTITGDSFEAANSFRTPQAVTRRARDPSSGTSGSLVRAAGQRLARRSRGWSAPTTSRERHQRARDVAGRHVRPQADRHRARLGGGHRDEHDARVPPRPALAAGRRRLQEAAARVPRDRRQAPHQDDVRAVRFGVGSASRSWASSGRPNPASTTPAGSRARAPRRCRTRRQHPRLEAYVKGVVGFLAKDARVLAWDVGTSRTT